MNASKRYFSPTSGFRRRWILGLLWAGCLTGLSPLAWADPPEASSRRGHSILGRPAEAISSRNENRSTKNRESHPRVPVLVQPELLPTAPSHRGAPALLEGIEVGIQPIGEVDIQSPAVTGNADIPPDHAATIFRQPPIQGEIYGQHWHQQRAAALSGEFCYRPLYFEEANLERYGTRCGFIQPLWSAARFYATIPALPYLVVADPADECRYKRYPYQAGRSAPRVSEMPPLSIRGGVVEATTAVGLIFLIP